MTAAKKKATRKPRAKKADPFEQLLADRLSPLGRYRPIVGYLHANGTLSQYQTEHMAWLSFDRAVSTCFGSAARRLRGTHQVPGSDSPIVAILMLVMGGQNTVVWKHRFDLPEDLSI
jgi:hypothetical protein